jgi:tryptophanyl-tRNA synthetase
MKNRVLSGITPSGNTLHLGNYAGAVKPQFELLKKGGLMRMQGK